MYVAMVFLPTKHFSAQGETPEQALNALVQPGMPYYLHPFTYRLSDGTVYGWASSNSHIPIGVVFRKE